MINYDKILDFFIFYKQGSIIFRENEKADYVYFLKEGRVLLYKNIGDIDRTISIIKSGEIFGEMALIDSNVRITSAKALDDITIIRLDEGTVKKLISIDTDFIISIFKSMTNKINTLSDMLEIAALNNNELKVVSLIIKYIKINKKNNLTYFINDIISYIASQITISIDNIIGVFEKLKKFNYIKIDSNIIKITDYKRLKIHKEDLKKHLNIF